MMRVSPGARGRVYLPNRSIVQSKPCGTVLTPATSVTIATSTKAMAKILTPSINISSPKKTRRFATRLHALRGGEHPLVGEDGFKVRNGGESAGYEPAKSANQIQPSFQIQPCNSRNTNCRITSMPGSLSLRQG